MENELLEKIKQLLINGSEAEAIELLKQYKAQ